MDDPMTAVSEHRQKLAPRVFEPSAQGFTFGSLSAFMISVWFGLAVGLVELGLTITQKLMHDPSPGFFRMNRNVVWTIPTVDLALFGLVGLVLALVARFRPRGAAWVSVGLLGGMALLALLLSSPRLHTAACLLLACGFGYRFAARVEPRLAALLTLVRRTLPVLAVGVVALVGVSVGREVWTEYRIMASLPPVSVQGQGAPNVLLVVMDTVRADRLSLYGYGRETSPNLAKLARRGVKFEQARSVAPWTLPSHASMMTGHWPHQQSARLHGPLDGTHPTIAELMTANGYATAGFVANTTYCGAETGLARGFAHYEDHDLHLQSVLSTSALGRRIIVEGLAAVSQWLGGGLEADVRKDAARVSRDLLAWTDRQGKRPFFAFVNLVDAHSPYLLPKGVDRHFGIKPESSADDLTINQWFTIDKKKASPRDVQLNSDAYDDCLAYLDEQLGRLFDELDRRGVLANTLVLVTSDHGEHFGEHDLYCHASSLYDQEIHVPLLAVLPGGGHAGESVAEPVSLRDLPATIADLTGLGRSASFPGQSLARCWDTSRSEGPEPLLAEVDGPAKTAPNLGLSPAFRGPMKALVSGQDVYIRNGDGVEEVYDLTTDPSQARNLAGTPSVLPKLDLFRKTMDQMTSDDTRPLAWRNTAESRPKKR